MACSYFSFFSTSAWAFVSIPLAVHYLDKEAIGLWSVINAILGYLAWMDFGISHAAGRLMAPAVAANDQPEINRWWTAISACLLAQAALVLIIGGSFLPLAMRFLDLEGPLRNDAFQTLFLGVIFAAITLPLRKVPGFLMAQERFHWVPLIMGFVPWCNLTAFYVFLHAGFGVKSYVAAMLGGQAISWLCYTLLIRFGPQRPRFDRTGLTNVRFRRIFSFSSGLMVFSVVESFLQTLPTMLISRLGGLTMVPIYNFSSKGAQMGTSLVTRTYQAFQPAWQRSYINGDLNLFQCQYNSAGYITLGIGTLAASSILVFNPLLIQFLAGPSYLPPQSVNLWFAVAVVSTPMGLYFQSLINLSGSVGKMPLFHFIKLALSIPLAWFAWKWSGLFGIACTFALIPLANAGLGYWLGNQHCGFSGRSRVGTGPAAFTLLIILWVAATGYFISDSKTPPDNSSIFFTISSISTSTLMAASTCVIVGTATLAWGWLSKRNTSTTNSTPAK